MLELLGKIFDFLQMHHVTPFGFLQQFEASRASQRKFIILQDAGDAVSFSLESCAHQEE